MSAMDNLQQYLRLNEDEAQFKAAIERVLEREYSFERHRRTIVHKDGSDSRFWKKMGELGWFSACLPESVGGYATSATGAMLLLEQCGKHLVVEPVLGGFLAPASVFAAADPGNAEVCLGGLVSGQEVWALAWCEPGRRYERDPRAVTAVREGAGWRLNGRKIVVQAAPLADKVIVSADTVQGPTLFIVPKLELKNQPASHTVDGQTAGSLNLEQIFVADSAVLGQVGAAMSAINCGLDWAAAGACAEAIGSMQAALDLTIAYDQTRKQFGQTLASFQVVQHRLAALATEIEYARSLLPLIAITMSASDAQRSAVISAAHWKIMTAARRVAFDAVQLHGGIGVTHEAEVSHHFRKITALNLSWGDASYHLSRYRRARPPGSDLLALELC